MLAEIEAFIPYLHLDTSKLRAGIFGDNSSMAMVPQCSDESEVDNGARGCADVHAGNKGAAGAVGRRNLGSETLGDGLILGFKIELDLHVVGVAEENLPTSAIRHLVYAVEHALAGEVLLHRLETTATERNVIDNT